MKGFLTRLLIVVMLAALSLFAFGCNNASSESEVESTSQSVSQSESKSESVGQSQSESEGQSESSKWGEIVGAGENGEVNLGDALELLSPILNNDYITVNFTLDASATENGVKTEAKTTAMAFVKRTVDGYDVVATFSQTVGAQGQSAPVASVSVYYVDGTLLYGLTDYLAEEVDTEWYKSEVGSFNELVSRLNAMIAANEENVETYKEIMKAVEKLEIILSEQDLTNKNIGVSADIAKYLNKALEFVLENKEQNLYDFLLESVMGVDASNPDEVAAFEGQIAELCNSNPTVYAVIDELVTTFNQAMIEEARKQATENGVEFNESEVFQLNLEELLDLLQEQTGMTTAQFIGLIKSEIPELDDYLTAPDEGESLYDYLSARAQIVTFDDIAKALTGNPDATSLTLLEGLKQRLSAITVGQAINGVLSNYLGDGQQTDYVALIEGSNFSFQALVLSVSFKTDKYGRPTEFGQNSRIQASLINPETGLTSDIITVESEDVLKVTLSYEKPFVSFEIPQEYLDMAQEA